MRQDRQATRERPCCLCSLKGRDQVGERAVVDPRPCGRRRDGEAYCQVRLAHAGRTQEDDVLPALDEAELVQALDR